MAGRAGGLDSQAAIISEPSEVLQGPSLKNKPLFFIMNILARANAWYGSDVPCEI